MTGRVGHRSETRDGQVAIITGGSQGIGYAAVEAFARHGMRVVAVSRDPGRLEAAVASLETRLRGQVVGVPADVRREAEVIAAVGEVAERFGRIDVLVNCAGVSMNARRRFSDTTTDEWHRVIDTNLTGTYLMCRAVLPHFEAVGRGYILNVLSTRRITEGSSLYAASKYGARALTEALIEEYHNSGIRVTSVSPGPVNTTIWGHKLVPPSEEQRALMLRPSDIVDIFIWLLSRPERMHIPDITVTPWVLRDAKAPSARSAQGS